MKKVICFGLVLLALLSCLTGCNVNQNIANALESEAEAAPKVKEMMTALAENRTADAVALMHPQAKEKSDAAIDQMCDYLAGRKANSLKMRTINVQTSAGTSGKTRQEQLSYQATLTDGTVIYLSAVYLSDNAGTGFISFQLVLGVV